jgi:hypothetical protein
LKTLTLDNDIDLSGKIKEIYLVLTGLITFFFCLEFQEFTISESFVIGYQLYLLLRFINNIGYTICFFDFLCFYSALDTLVMPVVGYRVFNENNATFKAWGWYMRVPADDYFMFLIPANLALFFSSNLFVRKYNVKFYKALIVKLAKEAKNKGKAGIVLTVIGFLSSFLSGIESSLAFVFYLFSMLKYVGPIYIYFSDLRLRKQAFIISILAFLGQAILQGMFGQFIMYMALAIIIIALQYNLKFISKLTVFAVSLFLTVVAQSVKGTYRSITWRGMDFKGLSLQNSSRFEIFGTLFLQRLTDYDDLFDDRELFGLYTRMNQGYLISRAMNYVPRVEPYANGETILRSVGAILVPRFLWPDKPEAGGRENLARFVGIKRRLNYSMNIGPYGEAYGNFGPYYGVLFIFVYGLFLSLIFGGVLKNSIRFPTLPIWSPLLFFSTLTVETDILSTLNSFVKSAIFVLLLFWICKKFFKVSL